MSSPRREPSSPYPAPQYPTYYPPPPTSAPPGASSPSPTRIPAFATPIGTAQSAAPAPPDTLPFPSAIPAAAAAINHAFDASAAAHELPPDLVARIAEQVRAEVVRSLREEMRVSSAAPVAEVPYYPPPPPGPPPVNNPAASGLDATMRAMQQQEQQRQQQLQQQRVQQQQQQQFQQQQKELQQQQQQQQQPQRHQSPQPPYPSIQRGSAGVLMPEAATFGAEGAGTGARRAIHTPPTPETQREGSEWPPSSTLGGRGGGMTSPGPGPGRGPPAATANSNSNNNDATSGRTGEPRRTHPESRGGGGPTMASERDPRPPPAPRVLTDEEETVVEKQWGALFEREERGGAPTRRLGQFLRGVAHHLVEDFEPRGSLVIGPKKMRRFYELVKVDNEIFPWRTIFDLPKPQLSALYSALSCSHHLISSSSAPFETPHLPALTPQGFETWATLFILASPDHEFHRLAAAVREWPICNADDRRDRLPKELSRRLFPAAGALVPERRRRLCAVLQQFGIVPVPEARQTQTSQSQHHQAGHGQGRRPTDMDSVSSMSETESDSEDETLHRHTHHHHPRSHRHSHSQPAPHTAPQPARQPTAPQQPAAQPPIERERKPYVAKEGSGKIHFDPAGPGAGPPPMARTASSTSTHSHGSTLHTPSSAGAYAFSAPSAFEHPGWAALHQQQQQQHAQQQAHQAHFGFGGGYGPAGAYLPVDERLYEAHPEESMLDVERELRRARLEEDMRTRVYGRGGGYGYDGNPPLGTGERRY